MADIKNEDAVASNQIYHTTYKKGPIMGHIHFAHAGGLTQAVEDVKEFLRNKHLKHIHTVPFLIDLKHDNMEEIGV